MLYKAEYYATMPRGHILKYKTPESLYVKGMEYINHQIEQNQPILLSELCLHLDINKDTLNDYMKREKYRDIVKKFRLFVEQTYEKMLNSRYPTGGIFALKNFGWDEGASLLGTHGEITIRWTNNKKKTPK